MRQRILLYSFALLIISLSCLLFVIPHATVRAYHPLADTPTPTLDPVKILNEANAVATQAAEVASKSDTATTTTNTVASGLNTMLVFFSVILAAVSIMGTIAVAWLDRKVKQVESAIKEVNVATAKVKETVGRANANLVTIANDVEKKANTSVTSAVASLSPKVDELRKEVTYLLRGYQLLEQGKKEQALKAFKTVLDIRPEDAQANYALGRIFSGDKSYPEAVSCLQTAIQTEPDFPAARMELGLALRRQADQLFEDATKGKTKEKDADVWKKAVKEREDRYFEAIKYLREADKSLPGDEDVLGALGGIYRRRGVYDTALQYYEEALNANPNSSYALGNVASLSYHLVYLQKARKAFEETIVFATKRIDAQDSREPWWDYYDRAMAKLVLSQIGSAPTNPQAIDDDYNKAIELTLNSESFESVLNGLYFLQAAQDKYDPPGIDKLDEIINRVKKAKIDLEEREKKQKEGKDKASVEAQISEETLPTT
jgi:tetratricopeptide (TPR) repeat protein